MAKVDLRRNDRQLFCDRRTRQHRHRLAHLHLQAVAAVIDPCPHDVRSLPFLEVVKRPDEYHRLTVVVSGLDDRPARFLAHIARATDGDL